MSVITQYQCSNKKCDFGVSLSKNFPVWKANTPKELQRVPVMKINEEYVLEKVSSHLCTSCGDVVSVEETTYVCPSCATANLFLKEGDDCPLCHIGIIEENEDLKIRF
jgi:Zn finger protein HypA/HybF involved in hydrogenase expression